MEYLVIAVRCLVAVIFGVSAFSKLRSRAALADFTATVRALRLAPPAQAGRVAAAVAAMEAVTPVLVLWPATAAAGLVSAVALLGALTVGIAGALRRGVQAPCRCFGSRSDAPLGLRHLVRNVALGAVVVAGASLALIEGPGRLTTLHAGGIALSLATGVVAAILVIAFDELVDLLRSPASTRPRSGDGTA